MRKTNIYDVALFFANLGISLPVWLLVLLPSTVIWNLTYFTLLKLKIVKRKRILP
jgi:hypothetical protein